MVSTHSLKPGFKIGIKPVYKNRFIPNFKQIAPPNFQPPCYPTPNLRNLGNLIKREREHKFLRHRRKTWSHRICWTWLLTALLMDMLTGPLFYNSMCCARTAALARYARRRTQKRGFGYYYYYYYCDYGIVGPGR